MSEILSYLNSPHLVASFQKVFGVEPEFSNHNHNHNESLNGHHHHHELDDEKPVRARLNRVHTQGNGVINMNGKKQQPQTTKLTSNLNGANGTITLTETKTLTTTRIESNGVSVGGDLTNDGLSSSSQHKRTNSNSSVKKQLVNVTDHSHLIANTTIHSR